MQFSSYFQWCQWVSLMCNLFHICWVIRGVCNHKINSQISRVVKKFQGYFTDIYQRCPRSLIWRYQQKPASFTNMRNLRWRYILIQCNSKLKHVLLASVTCILLLQAPIRSLYQAHEWCSPWFVGTLLAFMILIACVYFCFLKWYQDLISLCTPLFIFTSLWCMLCTELYYSVHL